MANADIAKQSTAASTEQLDIRPHSVLYSRQTAHIHSSDIELMECFGA